MARLIYSATASLDGFIAGPGGDMSWLTEHIGGENPTADRVLARTGAILVGRVTFGGDDPNAGTDAEGAFGGQYDGPVVVLTHRPPGGPGPPASSSPPTCPRPSSGRRPSPATATSTSSARTSPPSASRPGCWTRC